MNQEWLSEEQAQLLK